MDVVARYLELGLRLGRHVDGIVDAYFGPPEIAQRVEAEELRPAAALAADAEALREDVAASDLEPQRRAWLDDQLVGLSTYAAVVGGERIDYADEVERCFGVRPEHVPEARFEEAHARLDAVLPVGGTLAERYEAWREATRVPPAALLAVFAQVSAVLQDATRRRYGLPDGEEFESELAPDAPWLAYNYYLGGLRSRVAINPDRLIPVMELVDLAAHEAYPGHHTEHAWKERELVRAGVNEEALLMIPTPQSLVSEGIAENAWDAVIDDETAPRLARALEDAGVSFDLETATAVRLARRALRFVSANVALLIHVDGATAEEAQAYSAHWSATNLKTAAASARFITDPLWRSYVATYSYGGDLVRRHVAGDDDRFRALLTRHTRVADLAPLVSAS